MQGTKETSKGLIKGSQPKIMNVGIQDMTTTNKLFEKAIDVKK